MEKLPSGGTPEDRKAAFERWKQEMAEKEAVFLKTKDSIRRSLEQSKEEIEMFDEIIRRVFDELCKDIEENEALLKAETDKPFEEVNLDFVSDLQAILIQEYNDVQKCQDLLTDIQAKNHELKDKIIELEQGQKDSQRE